MRKGLFVLALGLTAVAVFALPGVAQAQPGSITFDPSSNVVAGGAKVFINVTCEANTEGFILSHALAGQPGISESASVPALMGVGAALVLFGRRRMRAVRT